MNSVGSELIKAPALARGFAILALVAREPGLGFSEIRGRLDLPKSSTHHLLATLCQLNALRLLADGGYVLGLHLVELAGLANRHHVLESEALPRLQLLSRTVQLTCHLGVIEGNEAVYLARIEGSSDIRINSWVGKRFPLNRSALGKVLLAWLPPAEAEQIIAQIAFEPAMPNTLRDAAALTAHLALVRERGWATDDEEDAPNIRCLAAPVRDQDGRVVAAISAVGTVLEIDQQRFARLAPIVMQAADGLALTVFGASSQSAAAPARTKPARTQPSRAEPVRAQPVRGKPTGTETTAAPLGARHGRRS